MSHERKKKKVQASSERSDTAVSSHAESARPNGVPPLQENSGRSLQRQGKSTGEAADEAGEALVPIKQGVASIRASSNRGGAKTLESIEPLHEDGLAARANEIDAQYDGGTIEGVSLPQPLIDTAQRWLRANHLIWSSNDLAFWAALEYVLDSLESFSIDAVEQALVICTTEAFDDSARRSTIYQELKACRALKKIRDMQLKIRTAQVVAERTLSAPHALAIRQQREAKAAEAERMREVSRAYMLFQVRENYGTETSPPFQNLTDAQSRVQKLMADPDRGLDGYDHPPTIHQVGLNTETEVVHDYGVVATVQAAKHPQAAKVKTGFADFDQRVENIAATK